MTDGLFLFGTRACGKSTVFRQFDNRIARLRQAADLTVSGAKPEGIAGKIARKLQLQANGAPVSVRNTGRRT